MNAIGRWAKRGVWLTLAAVLTIGCNPLQTVAFIFHKDDKLPAQYPLRPKEGPKKDKDVEMKVLVLCGTSGTVPQEMVGLDRELPSILAKRFPEAAKENKETIAVVPPSQVDKFRLTNPTWKTMSPATIGKKLGADYVLDITLSNVGMYQPGTGREVYAGRAEVFVDVYDVAAGPGEPKDHYVHQLTCPKTAMMVAAGTIPPSRFKQMFVDQLALELMNYHLEHRAADEIAAGHP